MRSLGHSHDPAEGIVSGCAACDGFVEGAVCDVALMIDAWTNEEFRLVARAAIDLQKLSKKARTTAQALKGIISGDFERSLEVALGAFCQVVKEIKDSYPRARTKRKETILEFMMAGFFGEYQRLPKIYFDEMKRTKSRSGRGPGNRDTECFVTILRLAMQEAEKIEKSRVGDKLNALQRRDDVKNISFDGDFGPTCAKILQRWGGKIPAPSDVFILEGDIERWSA